LQGAGKKGELLRFNGLDHQLDDSNARTQMLTRIGEFLEAAIGH
jgi:dipeptidyl aminopeptidase/acylaminoacyl peptidase